MNVWAASFALLACGLVAWVWWTVKRDTQRMVEDFQRMFPGRCAVCSFHRCGVMEGHERGPVEPHDCIERGYHRRGEEEVSKPIETPSGRMSANVPNPNLQNFPIRTEEGRRIRELFFRSRATNTKLDEHRREEEP